MNNYTNQIGAIISASVRGSFHETNDMPCQDVVSVKEGTFRGESYWIGSVADGHGHEKFVFSDRGAAIAALAAEQALLQFVLFISQKKQVRNRLKRHVAGQLKAIWVELIRQTCKSYWVSPQMINKHGSTILTLLVFRDHLYMAQLGDGVICTMDHSGQVTFVVEPESGPISNAADSLCCLDAENRWTFSTQPLAGIKTVLLATDGLVNSLASNKEIEKLTHTLDHNMRTVPIGRIQSVLPVWLENYSKQGSGDDCSLIAMAINPQQEKDDD